MPNSVTLTVPTTPATTPAPPTTPPSPLPHSRLARSHNRRFHVRFPGVDSEEHLLNYYSCALVADILLQGHLYITENFYAFYSNIFGRKTQILIPVSDVIKVTKERTAKIIPNAVGLYTEEGKYVFGSLLSRNTTYRLMHHVWLKFADPDSSEDTPGEISEPGTSDEPILPPDETTSPLPSTLDVEEVVDAAVVRRLSRRKSEIFPRISSKALRRQCASSSADSVVGQITLSECNWECTKTKECRTDEGVQAEPNGLPKTTLVLLAATVMLVILFLFATVLVYRVSIVHTRNSLFEETWTTRSTQKVSNYLEILRQQQEAVEDEIHRITNTLQLRMEELGKVRQSIDKLMAAAGGHPCRVEDTNPAPVDTADGA